MTVSFVSQSLWTQGKERSSLLSHILKQCFRIRCVLAKAELPSSPWALIELGTGRVQHPRDVDENNWLPRAVAGWGLDFSETSNNLKRCCIPLNADGIRLSVAAAGCGFELHMRMA